MHHNVYELYHWDCYRPRRGKWHVRHIVHVDRIMQYQIAVSSAPAITDPRVAFNQQGFDTHVR
jgi:hypothetical protein